MDVASGGHHHDGARRAKPMQDASVRASTDPSVELPMTGSAAEISARGKALDA